MRVRHLFLISLAAAVGACTGCRDSKTEQAELSWDSASLCIEEPIAPGETLCYQIKYELDTLADGSELARRLSAVLRDSVLCAPGYGSVLEAMAASADSIKAEWNAELAEAYEPELEWKEMLQFYYTIDGYPLEENQEDVLTYQTTTDCYLGGAHGSYVVHYYNFDKKSGKLLGIEDVIPAEKEMLVLMAMEEQLCADWDAKDLEDLQEQTGITSLGELYLTNNFCLRNDSIEFLFNQYEIAPYAAGLISVTIPLPASR